jgi:hypothetical protein
VAKPLRASELLELLSNRLALVETCSAALHTLGDDPKVGPISQALALSTALLCNAHESVGLYVQGGAVVNTCLLPAIVRRPPLVPSPLAQPEELPHDLFAVVNNRRVVFGRVLETVHDAQVLMTAAAERQARRIASHRQRNVSLLLWNGGATIRLGDTTALYQIYASSPLAMLEAS